MSEYQYYEFQTVDRKLTEKEQSQISKLSSRVLLTSNKAIFNYSYSDFPADPEEIVAKYFDAMLYMANWGTKKLMFRFPRKIIDVELLSQYCISDMISISKTKDHIILHITIDDEEGGGWIEGEGTLSSLIDLRQDILNGDYGCLYLVWLKASQLITEMDGDEDLKELPVPSNLKKLNSSLNSFIELFEIDDKLIAEAAKKSKENENMVGQSLENLIGKLTEKERNGYLLQLANGESNVGSQLLKRLRELSTGNKVTFNKRKDSVKIKAAKQTKSTKPRNKQKKKQG